MKSGKNGNGEVKPTIDWNFLTKRYNKGHKYCLSLGNHLGYRTDWSTPKTNRIKLKIEFTCHFSPFEVQAMIRTVWICGLWLLFASFRIYRANFMSRIVFYFSADTLVLKPEHWILRLIIILVSQRILGHVQRPLNRRYGDMVWRPVALGMNTVLILL